MLIDPLEEEILVNQKLATKLPYSLLQTVVVPIKQILPDGLFLERGSSLAQLLHGDQNSGRGWKCCDRFVRMGVLFKPVELGFGYDGQTRVAAYFRQQFGDAFEYPLLLPHCNPNSILRLTPRASTSNEQAEARPS